MPWASNDADGDGILDANDNCPNDPNPDQADKDLDTVGDACDNCLRKQNADQADSDNDMIGDVCDKCPNIPFDSQIDSDKDTHGDECDNCPNHKNKNQADRDGDFIGNVCDNCPNTPNADQTDTNGNGIGDACEPPIAEFGINPNVNGVASWDQLGLLPNPAKDVLNINLQVLQGAPAQITIYDQNGRQVWHNAFAMNETPNTIELNLKELKIGPGVYLVSAITDDEQRFVETLVVQ